jgi:hypothetical protein
MAAGRTSRARGAHMITVRIVDAKACNALSDTCVRCVVSMS